MFIGQEVLLSIEFEDARPRLIRLITSGKLDGASHAAYQDGLTAPIRVGPLGDVHGAAKLVRVRFLDPVEPHSAIWSCTRSPKRRPTPCCVR